MAELLPRVGDLARQAKRLNIGLTIDAEEVEPPRSVARTIRAAGA